MQLMPIFEKAGIETSTLLGMLRLNEVEGAFDFGKMGQRRQQEIFQEMIASDVYVAPQEWEDHQNYLKYSYYYTQTREFRDLSGHIQEMIIKHQKDREQLAASSAPPAPPGQGGGGAPAGGPGAGQALMSQPQPANIESAGLI